MHQHTEVVRPMVLTIPTGRNPTERVEVAPKRCPNGHLLGPRQVLGYRPRPDGVRARCWMCRTCGATTWDDQRTQ